MIVIHRNHDTEDTCAKHCYNSKNLDGSLHPITCAAGSLELPCDSSLQCMEHNLLPMLVPPDLRLCVICWKEWCTVTNPHVQTELLKTVNLNQVAVPKTKEGQLR